MFMRQCRLLGLLFISILLVVHGTDARTLQGKRAHGPKQRNNQIQRSRAASSLWSPAPASVHLTLGNPSNATHNLSNSDNFLVEKPQFVLSYNKSKGGPNWVSWHIDSSDIGKLKRPKPDPFAPDLTLPASWRILPSDYHFAQSHMERGHMCPSGDRNSNKANMVATFVMSNMLPQSVPLNEHVWKRLEEYERELVRKGKEVYIIAGGFGSKKVIKKKVNVPEFCWKIIVVLDQGNNDLSRINKNTRVIAVIMPNDEDLDASAPWTDFIKTVDEIEEKTGFDFLSNVPENVQAVIEAQKDTIGAQ